MNKHLLTFDGMFIQVRFFNLFSSNKATNLKSSAVFLRTLLYNLYLGWLTVSEHILRQTSNGKLFENWKQIYISNVVNMATKTLENVHDRTRTVCHQLQTNVKELTF